MPGREWLRLPAVAAGAEYPVMGLKNKLIDPADAAGELQGRIECRERLGGMLKYYCRKAA